VKISVRDEKVVLQVIELCAQLEERALAIYETLQGLAGDERMRELWSTMADDEREHRRYWQRLKDVCAAGAVPEVFDEPRRYVDELRALLSRFDHLEAQIRKEPRTPQVFIHVLRMEFLLLHPSFVTLFHYLPDGPGEVSPGRSYEKHLGRFLTTIMDYQQLTPELELLGEAIGQVWKKTEEGATRAVLDTLTGTHNRRGLYIAMKPLAYLARREKQNVGVLLIEIVNLKEINASHGHRVGDEILGACARAIAARLRASDVVGRFGGDDFLAMLTRFEDLAFGQIGRELIREIGAISVREARPSVRIGGATTVIRGRVREELEALIRAADLALAEARSGTAPCLTRRI
jgi:diguanylate cyclase (GGDEF)-like protein